MPPKITPMRWIALCGIVVLVVLEVRGAHALSGVARFVFFIPLCLLIAGLVPFFLGAVLQYLFCERLLHPVVSWTIAAVAVAVQVAVSGQASVTAEGHAIPTFVLSFLVWGVAMDSGVRFCQGWREGKQAVRTVPPQVR